MTRHFKSHWDSSIVNIFHCYHIAVFIWIIFGLVWLSGVVSLITDGLSSERDPRYQKIVDSPGMYHVIDRIRPSFPLVHERIELYINFFIGVFSGIGLNL